MSIRNYLLALVGFCVLAAQPALAAQWCMTHEPIPAANRSRTDDVVYIRNPVVSGVAGPRGGTYVARDFKRLCPRDSIRCLLVQRAPIDWIVERGNGQRTLGFTDGACVDPDPSRGRLHRTCVGVAFIAPHGSVDYLGRHIDVACENDTIKHEMGHFFREDWRGHHGRGGIL